jgi:virulence-associated protein VapD
MIRMEIEMNEERLQRQRGISAASVYKKIDAMFAERSIIKQDTGIYIEAEGRDDLSSFCILMRNLRKAKWFYPYVNRWMFDVDGEVTDVVASYTRVEQQEREAEGRMAVI